MKLRKRTKRLSVKIRRSVKAVSPVISVLLMIVIAVAAALIAYAWIMGYFGRTSTEAQKAIMIQSIAADTNMDLIVYVQNVGIGNVQLDSGGCTYVSDVLKTCTINGSTGVVTVVVGQTVNITAAFKVTFDERIKIKVVTAEGIFAEYTGMIKSAAAGTPGPSPTPPPTYSIGVTVDPSSAAGYVTPDTSGQVYNYNDMVTLTPHANSGYTFDHWSGDGAAGSGDTWVVTVTGNMHVSAIFTQNEYSVGVTIDPVGAGIVTPDKSGPYHYGDVVTLTQQANPGYTFSAWSGAGVNSGNDRVVTVTGDMAVTATFTQDEYSIGVTILPDSSAGTVLFDNYGPYHYNDVVTLTQQASLGYTFDHWSGDGVGSGDTRVVTVTGNMYVNATYTQNEYTISVTINPDSSAGSVLRDKPGPYHYGDVVTLTPQPSLGYMFSAWSGDGSAGSGNTWVVTVTGNMQVNATFTQNEYTIVVTIDPVGAGTVSSDPAGPSYHYNDVVTLTPHANPGYTFSGWSGDGVDGAGGTRVVTVTGNMQVTATFTQNEYTISVTVLPSSGAGSVLRDNPGPYHYGDVVTLTPNANPGYTFSAWSQDGVDGPGNTRVVTVTGNMQVTATFTQNQYSIGVTILPDSGAGWVSFSNNGPYHYNDVVTLTPHANSGYTFDHWSGDGSAGSGDTWVVTVTGNMQVTATFTKIQYTLTVNIVGSGSVTKTPNLALYDPGTVVQLEAIPNNGYYLSQWTGDLTGSNNFASLTMDSDKTVTATFVQATQSSSILWLYWSQTVQSTKNFTGMGLLLGPTSAGKTIVLTFTKPDGTTIVDTTTRTVIPYIGLFEPQVPVIDVGTWHVTAQFLGDSTYGACTAASITFTVTTTPTYTVHFVQSGIPGGGPAPTVTFHIDSGSDQQGIVPFDVEVLQGHTITYSYQTPVYISDDTHYVLHSTSPYGPLTITSDRTITGTYTTEYMMTLSYSVTGGGSPTAPSFTANRNGTSTPQTLTNTPTAYYFDAGASWGVTNPLGGSGASERWYTSQSTSGTVSITTIAFVYYHQYNLTVTASPSGAIGGTFQVTYTQFAATHTSEQHTTTWGSWADASTTATVGSPQSPVGSYTFSSYNPSASVTMDAAKTITLTYTGTGTFGYTTPGGSTSTFSSIRGSRYTCTTAGTAQSISVYLDYTPSTTNLGNTAGFGTSYSTSIMNTIVGQRIQTPSSQVVVQSITAYIGCTTASKNMKAAIYTDSGTFVAESNEISVGTGSASRTFTFASPPTLAASTYYVIVVYSQSASGDAVLYASSNSGGAGRSASGAYPAWPSVSSWTTNTYNYRIYCTYYVPATVQCAIYSSNGGQLLGTTEQVTLTSSTGGWVTLNFVGTKPTLSASTNYVLMAWSSDSSNVNIYYDSGSAERFTGSGTYNNWPSTVTDYGSTRNYSIYCTYSIP
jgi:uncharacterized repeat protein (TIGR02543 family)